MTQTNSHRNPLHLLAAAALLVSFFLPWVKWEDNKLAGMEFPAGNFFAVSADKFGLDNPYPQFSFTFYLFWLIPVFTLLATFLHIKAKKTATPAVIAGMLSLSLVTVYAVFSNTLVDLGVATKLQPFLYIQAVAAILLIATSRSVSPFLKVLFVLSGPLLTYGSFRYISHQLENATFSSTKNEKPAYTVNADELIREFVTSDSSANAKYTDKIIVVNGTISELEAADSTMNVKFTDSTSGSYAIFDFQAEDAAAAKKLAVGDHVSIKASCSGGIFSRLRQATVISFKRSAINK